MQSKIGLNNNNNLQQQESKYYKEADTTDENPIATSSGFYTIYVS